MVTVAERASLDDLVNLSPFNRQLIATLDIKNGAMEDFNRSALEELENATQEAEELLAIFDALLRSASDLRNALETAQTSLRKPEQEQVKAAFEA